jgi:hypothetical protein
MCVFEFEVAKIELPTVVLFPEMCTRFGNIPSNRNVAILYSESVIYNVSDRTLSN